MGEVIAWAEDWSLLGMTLVKSMARMVLEDRYDLIDGSRLAGKPAATPWTNYFANWSFAIIASIAFLRWIRDLHSRMRAYRETLLDRLRYDVNGAALPVELLLRPIREGCKIKVITIPYRDRIGESTMRPPQRAALQVHPRFAYTGGDRAWKGDVPIVRLNTDRIRNLSWSCRRSTREALRTSLLALIGDDRISRE